MHFKEIFLASTSLQPSVTRHLRCVYKMASSPCRGATRENRRRELEEGTRRTITNSKMSYATGYLLRIGKDAAFGSPMRAPGSHSLGLTTRRSSPLSDRTASPIRLKFGRRSPTAPLQDLWYVSIAMMVI